MTTEVIAPLAIPEQVVSGTGGSYTIPANKYAELIAQSSVGGAGAIGGNNFGSPSVSTGGQSSSTVGRLIAGDVITTSQSYPDFASSLVGGASAVATGQALIFVNGVLFSGVYLNSVVFSPSNSSTYRFSFTGQLGWHAYLYSIPKNNLPDELKEGN